MHPRALTALLVAGLALAACKSEVKTPDIDGDLDGLDPIDCDIDSSISLQQPYEGALDTALRDTFCPKKDRDYWKIRAGGPGQLLGLELTYAKLSNIELAAEVYGPQGRCLPTTATACTSNAQCTTAGEICDLLRSTCRSATAPVCTSTPDCEAPNQCVLADYESLGVIREEAFNGANHRLVGNFAGFATGDYVVVVYDHAEREADATQEYSLTVSAISDVDGNEPNNVPNQGTPIVSGTTMQGAISFVNDVDYYSYTPSFSRPAVARIDLTWPATATMDPRWSITQGNWTFHSNEVSVLEGAGEGAVRSRRSVIVTPSSGPITIKVEEPTGNSSATLYDLRVEIIEDVDEPAVRDDVVANATDIPLGSAGSAVINVPAHKIIANNDADWYRFERNATADNTLLYVRAQAAAPATAGWLLTAQFFAPTTTVCSDTVACSQGRPCSPEGVCLDLYAQRPGPDGPGDPQEGGLNPNYLETQLPLQQDVLYLRLVHNSAAVPPVAGWSWTQTYTLTVQHKVEPDAVDRSANPDNSFLGRPLAPNVSYGDFDPVPRLVGGLNVTPSVGDGGIAVVVPTNIAAGTCGAVVAQRFDDTGAAVAATGAVSVSVDGGDFVDDCTAQNVVTSVDVGASTTLPFRVTAGRATPVAITMTVDGNSVVSYVAVAGPVTSFAAQTGQPQHGFARDSLSTPVRITLSGNAATALILNLSLASAGNGKIVCAPDSLGNCANATLGSPTDRCGADPTSADSSCQVVIAPGTRTYDIRVTTDAITAPAVLTVTPASTYPVSTFAWAVYTPGSVETPVAGITGYLSYDGDQDFFRIPVSSIVGAAGLTLRVTYAASQIDLRVSAGRDGRGGSYSQDNDICMDGCGAGGTCDVRNQCSHAAVSFEEGPRTSTNQCTYIRAGSGDVLVWVNDVNANDWDTTNPYQITVEVDEGCPAECGRNNCTL